MDKYAFEWVSREEEYKFEKTLEFLKATKLSESPSYIVLMTKNFNPHPVGYVIVSVHKHRWVAIKFKSNTKPEEQLLYDQVILEYKRQRGSM